MSNGPLVIEAAPGPPAKGNEAGGYQGEGFFCCGPPVVAQAFQGDLNDTCVVLFLARGEDFLKFSQACTADKNSLHFTGVLFLITRWLFVCP